VASVPGEQTWWWRWIDGDAGGHAACGADARDGVGSRALAGAPWPAGRAALGRVTVSWARDATITSQRPVVALVLRRLRATGCYVGSLRAPFGDGAVQGKQGRAAAARDLACGLVWATGQIKGASKGHERRGFLGSCFVQARERGKIGR